MQLRKYQGDGIEMLRCKIASSFKRILFFLATGGGKSVIFSSLVKNILEKNKKVILVMRRRGLITQAQKNLAKWGVKSSIIMAQEKGFNPDLPVQICSIDTIHRRIEKEKYKFLSSFDIVLIDEAHDATSPSYQKFLDKFLGKIVIGFTASPFEIGTKIHDFWETVVKPVEMHELRDMGYLTDAELFAPKVIDTKGIKVLNGDFKLDELAKRVSEMKVIGDIVDTYKQRGNGKPAILFAVNKAHSMLMAAAFNHAGIPAAHRDESHNLKERTQAIKALESGEIKVLCNVNIFSTGTDIPCAVIGIMARPTMSEVLFIQQIGRLLRPFKICAKCNTERGGERNCHVCGSIETSYDKKNAIIFDHADNISRHGLPFDIRDAIINEEDRKKKKRKKKDEEKEEKIRRCPDCAYIFNDFTIDYCPSCGFVFQKKTKDVKTEDGELVKIDQKEQLKIRIFKEYKKLNYLRQAGKIKLFYGEIERKLYKMFGSGILPYIKDLGLSRKVINEQRKRELLSTTSEFIEKSAGSGTKGISRY
jgi:DNA repair protein RadD